MTETTQKTDAEHALYLRLLHAGHKVKIEQINTCPHCEKPYRVVFADGSSKAHCKEEACRFAAAGDKKQAQNKARISRYFEGRKPLDWKHDNRREDYKTRKNLAYHAEFSYV